MKNFNKVVAEIYFLIFIIMGACAGSFCHAMALRLGCPASYRKKDRSVCDACGRKLSLYEILPIVSFLSLKGRCRTCHHKLPSSMLFAEVGSSLIYAGVFFYPTLFSYKWLLLLVFHLLLIAAITDLYFMIIPNRLLLLILLLSLLLIWFIPLSIFSRFLGLLLGFGLPLLVLTLTRGGLGGGDVKLFILLGWLIGWFPLLRLMILSCTCGILGFLLLPLLKNNHFPSRLPFAPFILLGFILEFIWDLWRSTGIFLFRG